MAQRNPEEQTTFDQVLKLVANLSPEAQEQLIEQMKRQWLQRELQVGVDQLDRGEGIAGAQVFEEVRRRLKQESGSK
jgi:hypothetical protein